MDKLKEIVKNDELREALVSRGYAKKKCLEGRILSSKIYYGVRREKREEMFKVLIELGVSKERVEELKEELNRYIRETHFLKVWKIVQEKLSNITGKEMLNEFKDILLMDRIREYFYSNSIEGKLFDEMKKYGLREAEVMSLIGEIKRIRQLAKEEEL